MRSALLDVELVPAHVRNFSAIDFRWVETNDPPFEDIESAYTTKFDTF